MTAVQTLKAQVDLRTVVQETHPLTKSSKTLCLWHDDTDPSLHIYPDGYFCFACGASGDHLDWLTATRALSFQEALDSLARCTGTHFYPTPIRIENSVPSKDHSFEKPTFEWCLPLRQHQLETHERRAARLTEVPDALADRGFTLADCRYLKIASENGNAIFPVIGPNRLALTLKCRYAVPNPHRYEYITPGRGTPSWCSPDIQQSEVILIVEGELNGMVCWLAVSKSVTGNSAVDNDQPHIGVMGTAGAHGSLHLEVLRNKVVYLYADDDDPGEEARQRWARQAFGAGAKEVLVLEPWPNDACDVAGAFGKAALRKRLTWSRKQPFVPTEPFGAVGALGATPLAPKQIPSISVKPDLVQWCSQLRAVPKLGSAIRPLSLSATYMESRHDVA